MLKFHFFLLFVLIPHISTSKVIETEYFCPNNIGHTFKETDRDCLLMVSCTHTGPYVYLVCGGNNSFFSFDPKHMGIKEIVTSVYFKYPNIWFTTREIDGHLKGRTIKGTASESGDWIILKEKKGGYYKFEDPLKLVFFKGNGCLKKNGGQVKNCSVKEIEKLDEL